MNIKDILQPGTTFNVQNMNVFVMGKNESTPKVVNPGIEYGEDGQAKMSPPLQQQLDIMKDLTGPTTDDTTVEPSDEEVAELTNNDDQDLERIKKLAAIFTPVMQFP
jgi:hypothetical protein